MMHFRFAGLACAGLVALCAAGCHGQTFAQWLEGEPESLQQWRTAEGLFRRRRYEEAAVAMRAWLADYRDAHDDLRPFVLYKLGECYRAMRDYGRAARVYRKLIQMYANSANKDVRALVQQVVKPRLDSIAPRSRPRREGPPSKAKPPER